MEGKENWRSKRERLACEMVLLEALTCREDAAEVSKRSGGSPADELLSPTWFAELDDKIDELARILLCLQDLPIGSQKRSYAQEARQELSDICKELRQYLAAIDDEIRRLCVHRTVDQTETEPHVTENPQDTYRKRQLKATTSFRGFGSKCGFSPREKVMNRLFKWWRPCGPDCVRDAQRFAETRMTEVDGRLVQ